MDNMFIRVSYPGAMAGRITSIYLSEEIYRRAKEREINVSKVCREALSDAVAVSVTEEEYQRELEEARAKVERLESEREATLALREGALTWISAKNSDGIPRTLRQVRDNLHMAAAFKLSREEFLNLAEQVLQ